MFRPVFARLFGKPAHHPAGKSPRRARRPAARLRVETLEAREVPAHLVWTNATGDGCFGTAGNWFNLDTNSVATWNPAAGDDIYFDGDVSSANCYGMFAGMSPHMLPIIPLPPAPPMRPIMPLMPPITLPMIPLMTVFDPAIWFDPTIILPDPTVIAVDPTIILPDPAILWFNPTTLLPAPTGEPIDATGEMPDTTDEPADVTGAVVDPPGEPADPTDETGAIIDTTGEPVLPSPGEYRSVNLIDGYAGTVSTYSGFGTGSLVMESGALFQEMGSMSDVRVSQTFVWTGGTLGGTHANTSAPGFVASHSTLHLLGGSTATIDPGRGNAVAAGSTLSFEAAPGVGSTGTLRSGAVNFVGGLGVVIDNLCTLNAQVTPATATFVDTPQPGAAAKQILVKSGGKMLVSSAAGADGGTFESAIPLMNYGTFQIEKNATAVIKGAVPLGAAATNPSIYQNAAGAAIRIENGSKLVAEKGISLLGGTLATLAKADPPQNFAQAATIVGKVSLSAGDVYVCEGSDSHVFGTLVFESDVWLGAATLHIVVDGRAPGTGDAGKSDLLVFKASLLDGLAQPTIKVTTINVPEGGANQNQIWEFVRVTNPITAVKPTVTGETTGVNYQVMDSDQNRRWCFKPTA